MVQFHNLIPVIFQLPYYIDGDIKLTQSNAVCFGNTVISIPYIMNMHNAFFQSIPILMHSMTFNIIIISRF